MEMTAKIARLEHHLAKLDLVHELMGHEIEDVRAVLSSLKADAGLPGQPEFELGPPAAGAPPPATAKP